jgi:hypothetical protein
VPSMKKMHWRLWPRTARIYFLRIINWPAGVPAPGPDFDLKTLDMIDLGALVEQYIENKRNGTPVGIVPRIVRWTDGGHCLLCCCSARLTFGTEEKSYANHDRRQGDILLVVSIQGVPLRVLRDCQEWVTQYKKAKKSHRLRMRASGIAISGSDSESNSVESEDDAPRVVARSKKRNTPHVGRVRATSKQSIPYLSKEEARMIAALRANDGVVINEARTSQKRGRKDISSDGEHREVDNRREKAVHHDSRTGYRDDSRAHPTPAMKKIRDHDGRSHHDVQVRPKNTGGGGAGHDTHRRQQHSHHRAHDERHAVKRMRNEDAYRVRKDKALPTAGSSRMTGASRYISAAKEYEYVTSGEGEASDDEEESVTDDE